MEWSKILSVLAILLDTIGVALIFFNTPKISYQVFLFSREESKELEKKAKRKNRLNLFGFMLIALGVLLQVIVLMLNTP